MGLLNVLGKLGKIGSMALDFVPGGGAAKSGIKVAKLLSKGASAAGDIGSVLGKQQQGKAAGKYDQAELQQAQDRNAINLFQAQQGAQNSLGQLDLQRKAFTTNDRGANAQQSLVAKMLGNFSPTQINVPGVKTAQVSGGLARSLQNNPGLLATLAKLAEKSDGVMSDPGAFQGGAAVKAPGLTALPQVDKGGFLSTLANLGQLAGAAGKSFQGSGDPGAAALPSLPDVQPLKKLPGQFMQLPPFGGG